jgi:uncharacterized protein (DUF4415 family)
VRPFKGIFCDDISEFESDHLSQPVRISLRIDRDILDHFQEAGPGWQDRINEALLVGQ